MNEVGCLDYHCTRRQMLKTVGAILLGMPVTRLLAMAGTSALPARAQHVILFWMGGGMSHLDTWDPKPGRPTQGEFHPIATAVDGIQISELFPQLARQMRHVSLIRSLAGTNGDHGRASYELQTSYNPAPNLLHPGIGSIVVHEREPLGDLPGFVTISGNAARAGYLGQRCEAYFVGRPGDKDPYLAFPAGISQVRGQKRLELLAKMNNRTAASFNSPERKANEAALEKAVELMRSPSLSAFDLTGETQHTLDRYGDSDFGRGALLARRLVEHGVRFVQVNRGGFDTHSNNFATMRAHGEIIDPALSSLIEDLAANGMLSKTLVVVLSEFGRTPRINSGAGRDHHAKCFSCLMAGGGLVTGQVVGASDRDGELPSERPVKVADIHATICAALGIDYTKTVMTPLQRQMRLVRETGTPIRELLG
jgi:hypothetical protein